MAEKMNVTWKMDQDIIEAAAEWSARTRCSKGDASQLGVWIVMHLSPQQRDEAFVMMDAREKVGISITQADESAIVAEAQARADEATVTSQRAAQTAKRRRKDPKLG
jgi:hypothetical protein